MISTAPHIDGVAGRSAYSLQTSLQLPPTGAKLCGRRAARIWGLTSLLMMPLLLAGTYGCSHECAKVRYEAFSSLPAGMTIAVAPALNHSGSSVFDPVRVADLMASELGTVRGVNVIGVNRVLAILADQGTLQIESPQHAIDVCERLGADAILVYAVTEYDPYQPVVGMTAQLYGRKHPAVDVDPVATSRSARPMEMPEQRDLLTPIAQVQRVFNGVHEDVQKEVREYAENRNENKPPYGWRKYLASQEWYLRFCCYAVIRELVQSPPSPEPVSTEVAAPQEHGT
jgi:hypothetical protein